MEFLGLNSSALTPRGFRPVVHGPRAGVGVAPRRVWGADDIAALREAPLVHLEVGHPESGHPESGHPESGHPESGHPADERAALATVVGLALAGVPVTGHGLPGDLRERLDPGLLAALDAVTPDTVRDAGDRELLSLALRRRAWQAAGYRPRTGLPPAVLVLLPEGELPSTLTRDLERQETPDLTVRQRQVAEGQAAEHVVREEGPTYVTRMIPAVRYGPHHLADLVQALGHSGARVALSPRRFLPWHGGTWLEDGSGPSEASAEEGLPGGSLWYAVDGASEPVAAGGGYAVHGAGAVPVRGADGDPVVGLVPLQLHADTPRVLDWHDERSVPSGAATPSGVPASPRALVPSYFAGVGTG